MNEQRHIVWQMTINGITDLVCVFPREQVDWSPTIKQALDATRDFYFRHIEPNRRLNISVCDCDNPNRHVSKVVNVIYHEE